MRARPALTYLNSIFVRQSTHSPSSSSKPESVAPVVSRVDSLSRIYVCFGQVHGTAAQQQGEKVIENLPVEISPRFPYAHKQGVEVFCFVPGPEDGFCLFLSDGERKADGLGSRGLRIEG